MRLSNNAKETAPAISLFQMVAGMRAYIIFPTLKPLI